MIKGDNEKLFIFERKVFRRIYDPIIENGEHQTQKPPQAKMDGHIQSKSSKNYIRNGARIKSKQGEVEGISESREGPEWAVKAIYLHINIFKIMKSRQINIVRVNIYDIVFITNV